MIPIISIVGKSDSGTTLLVLVCLANLVTLPRVWILFPSFVPFSNYETRAFGILLGIAALYFSFVLYLFFVRLEGRHRWKFLAANLLVLLLVFPAGSFFILLSIGYSHQYELLTSGLPGTWLLLISEVFAWLYEAVFLYFLSSKKLVWKHALLLSLLMNLTSYLAGWLSLVI